MVWGSLLWKIAVILLMEKWISNLIKIFSRKMQEHLQTEAWQRMGDATGLWPQALKWRGKKRMASPEDDTFWSGRSQNPNSQLTCWLRRDPKKTIHTRYSETNAALKQLYNENISFDCSAGLIFNYRIHLKEVIVAKRWTNQLLKPEVTIYFTCITGWHLLNKK